MKLQVQVHIESNSALSQMSFWHIAAWTCFNCMSAMMLGKAGFTIEVFHSVLTTLELSHYM